MLISRQTTFKFCIPRLKTLQPVLPLSREPKELFYCYKVFMLLEMGNLKSVLYILKKNRRLLILDTTFQAHFLQYVISRSAHRTADFNFPNLSCCKVFLSF